MSTYVVLPETTTTRQVHLPTVVLCGTPENLHRSGAHRVTAGSPVSVLTTVAEVQAYADSHPAPDECVIVTPLPDGPAIPLIRRLRARGWERILVLSPKADARAVHATVANGVCGVVVGTGYTPHTSAAPTDASGTLSGREIEVLQMVADGLSNRQVGEHLGVSGLTIKSHLARIARKLGCGDRAEMVGTAIRRRYIS